LLDAKSISSLTFGSEGLSGNQLAFGVGFSDGSQAIHVAADTVVAIPGGL
jgi:hypothetical protein